MDKAGSGISGQPCSQPWLSSSLSPSPRAPKNVKAQQHPRLPLQISLLLLVCQQMPKDQSCSPISSPSSKGKPPLYFLESRVSSLNSPRSCLALLGLPPRTSRALASCGGLGCHPTSARSPPSDVGQSLLWASGSLLLDKVGDQRS